MGIEKIQQYLGVEVTGIWCKNSVTAAKKLQKKHSLPETGLPVQSLKDLIQSLLTKQRKDKDKKQQAIRHPKQK